MKNKVVTGTLPVILGGLSYLTYYIKSRNTQQIKSYD